MGLGHRSIGADSVSIHHDDVINLFVHLVGFPKFRSILVARFPLLLVDEYQDMNNEFAEAIKAHFLGAGGHFMIGFFGDHWQKIYPNVCGKIEHPALTTINKPSVPTWLRHPFPPLITVEGGEGIHAQCSSRTRSSPNPHRRSRQLRSGGMASVASHPAAKELPTPATPRRHSFPIRRSLPNRSAGSSLRNTNGPSSSRLRTAATRGAIGALLRREALYSSHLTTWRRQREQGELQALAPKRRGRKSTVNPLAQENQRLHAEVARLSRRLQQAELIIDVQKKSIGPAGDLAAGSQDRRGELMNAAHQLGQTVGRAAACRVLNVPRASLYRHLRPNQPAPRIPQPQDQPRALVPAERQQVLEVLHSERFRDKAPTEVFCHPAGRGNVPVLRPDHVPYPRAGRRGPRTP